MSTTDETDGDDPLSALSGVLTRFSGDDVADPDPNRIDHDKRRQTRVAPTDVELDRIQGPFIECCCDRSFCFTDPLGDSGVSAGYESCSDPRPATIEKARETYIRYMRARFQDEDLQSKPYKQKQTYHRILAADRRLQVEYDDVTTALVTRRLSPLDDSGNWLTPWRLESMLSLPRRSVLEAINYQLESFDSEYVRVTAVTETAATPHDHLYYWVDDPDNEIGPEYFRTGRDQHVEKCQNAYRKHHQFRVDGSDGAITVQTDPDTIDTVPEKIGTILDNSAVGDGESVPAQTQGAQYVATQLPHMHLFDKFNPAKSDPPDTLLEGGAFAWLTPHRWFSSSSGV